MLTGLSSLQSASKLLRHSYPLESISSSVRKWPPPPHPRNNVVFFCFLRALSTAVQHWLGWGREGYPGNVLFGQVFFANNECVVASVLCWQLSQLILSPIVARTSNFQKNICFKMSLVGLININTKECKGARHLWKWSLAVPRIRQTTTQGTPCPALCE